MKRNWTSIAVAAAILLALVVCAANVVLGNLNLDEGWYLNAARLVADGKLPYRDFFYTQAPLMPHVYALLSPLWGPQGVLGGRVATAIFGLLSVAFAALAVRAAVPEGRKRPASLAVFALLACNAYHSYFTVIPKTYALASFFLMLGVLALSRIVDGRCWRDRLLAAGAGLSLAAAAATRLSLGAALAIAGFWLLFSARRLGASWFFFGIGGVVGLAAFLLPDALRDLPSFLFATSFHGVRGGGGLMMAAGSVSRLARSYMPLCLVVFAAFFAQGVRPLVKSIPPIAYMWLLLFAGLFAIHAMSPFPYDDYHVPAMPLLACAAVSALMNALPESERIDRALPLAFLLGAAIFAFTSTVNEDWVVVRKDRFWVQLKHEPDIVRLRRVARELRDMTPPGKPILTTDTYLAVEAGRPVPSHFEMGPFGYFPNASDKQTALYHILNRERAAQIAETSDAPCAAFSEYAFALAAPGMSKIDDAERAAILEEVTRCYETVRSVPDFGQEHTTLWIGRRRQPSGADGEQ